MYRNKNKKAFCSLFLAIAVLFSMLLSGCSFLEQLGSEEATQPTNSDIIVTQPETESSTEEVALISKEDVAAYIHEHGVLPDNFITKKEAIALGWDSSEGNLWEVAPGKSIGGDVFGNYEKRLPQNSSRTWYECDINYQGGYRGAERILYSNDGLIYYTDDHYETFTEISFGD